MANTTTIDSANKRTVIKALERDIKAYLEGGGKGKSLPKGQSTTESIPRLGIKRRVTKK